jgi:catechol 2,3-dioxygenase-like lactoylglutathione lyase family enzyme
MNTIFQCTDAFITLASTDIKELVLFYTQLLGQEPKQYTPNIYADFQLPGLRLGIFKPKQSNESEFENSAKGGMSLCLEVRDLQAAIAHLATLGYPPPGEIVTASHDREIYAYDPNGNRLILHQTFTRGEGR